MNVSSDSHRPESPATPPCGSALSYVIRHSKPSASITMASRLDRPEGYGIVTPAYRLSMAHRRPLSSGPSVVLQPKKIVAENVLLKSVAATEATAPSPLEESIAAPLDDPAPCSHLFEGVIESSSLDLTQKVSGFPLLLSKLAALKSAVGQKATGGHREATIAPGGFPPRALSAPLTTINLQLYRREPHDAATGESLLDALRFQRAERWVEHQNDLAERAAQLASQKAVVRDRSASPTKKLLTFITEGDDAGSKPASPLSTIVGELALTPNWSKLRSTLNAVKEVCRNNLFENISVAETKPDTLMDPFSGVETPASLELSWMARRLSNDGATTRLFPQPIKSSALLSEHTVEPTVAQQLHLHSMLPQSTLRSLNSFASQSPCMFGTVQSMSFTVPVTHGSAAVSRIQRVFCRDGGHAPHILDARSSASFSATSERSMHKRLWNAEFQTCIDTMYNATSAKAAIASYEKLRTVHTAFVQFCVGFVTAELRRMLQSAEFQIAANNVLFSIVSVPLEDLPEDVATGFMEKATAAKSSDGNDDDDSAEETTESAQRQRNEPRRYNSIDPTLQQRKVASNDLAALTYIYQNWWKIADPHYMPCTTNPFTSTKLFPVLSYESNNRLSQSKRKARHETCAFPLVCHVQHMGHTVVCTAELCLASGPTTIAEVQQTAATNAETAAFAATCQEGLCSLGTHLRAGPYVRESRSGDRKSHDVIFTSSKVLVGSAKEKAPNGTIFYRAYLTSLATLLSPIVPQAGLAPTLRLRPEFSSSMTDSVVSDAFDASITSNEMPKKCGAQVLAVKTMRRLMHKSFSNLLNSLEASAANLKGADLCIAFHHCGINLTFMGRFGDLVLERLRCVRSRTSSGPSNAAVERLTRLAAVVREELTVRAFRHCWSAEMRSAALLNSSINESELRQLTTSLIRSLLGSESDAEVTSFWQNHMTPTIREKFGFRSPISRGDVGTRSILRRLEVLCGISMGECRGGEEKHHSSGILGAEVLEARSAKLGIVELLVPYVKTPGIPTLPPVWQHMDLFSNQIEKALEALLASVTEEETPDSENVLCVTIRLAEVYYTQGEHKFRVCEHLLSNEIRRRQLCPSPLHRDLVELCVSLAAFYHAEHRYPDAIKLANDAIQLEIDFQTSPQQPLLEMMFAVVAKACRDSSKHALGVTTLERCVVLLMKRMNALELSPISIVSSGAGEMEAFDCPADAERALRLVDNYRTLLQNFVTELAAAYAAAGPEQFPPLADIVCNVSFLRFLCDLALDEFKSYRTVPGVATFARCVQLADELKRMALAGLPINKDVPVSGPMEVDVAEKLLAKCNQNLVVSQRLAQRAAKRQL